MQYAVTDKEEMYWSVPQRLLAALPSLMVHHMPVTREGAVGRALEQEHTLAVRAQVAEPVWHPFVVRHLRRDAPQRQLAGGGMGTLIHYPIPHHLSVAYAYGGWVLGDFPAAENMPGRS